MYQVISLIPNAEKEESFAALTDAAKLLSACGARVQYDVRWKSRLSGICGEGVSEDALFSATDLVITFGGDGTLLSAANAASANSVPLLGINFGRVGFLTGLSREELLCLSGLFDGDHFRIEERMMLAVTHRGKVYHALNEACVVSKNSCALSEFDVSVDDTLIGHYHADGIIIATATGSTAYSLSAGGAVVDPRLACLCITPVCPHSLLRARPLIEPPQAKIRLSHISGGKGAAVLCVDGREEIELADAPVSLERSTRVTRLLKRCDEDFCGVLYSKFNERA